MFSKTIKAVLLFFVFCMIPCAAQTAEEAEKQRELYEEKTLESIDEHIQEFLSDLKIDEFQKEILKLKLDSYYEKRKAFFMDGSLKYYERDEKLDLLNTSHFSDIKNMFSEETMSQIQIFITDVGATLEKQKKKKKKNKKNKQKTNE